MCACVCVNSVHSLVCRYICTDSEQDLQKLMAALVKAKVSLLKVFVFVLYICLSEALIA